jgi:nucleotide-binding universal stress UspA family protein
MREIPHEVTWPTTMRRSIAPDHSWREMTGIVTVGIDGSDGAREALRFAFAEASLRDATLRVVHAWSRPPLVVPGMGARAGRGVLADELRRWGEQLVAAELERMAPEVVPHLHLEPFVVRGDAAGALVKTSVDSDLLVVGSHGRGAVSGVVLGSVSEACMQHAACPVAVVHSFHERRYGRIVVGIDDSQGSRAAFEWAVEEARARNATVHAVAAYEEWGPVVGAFANPAVLVELECTVADEAKRALAVAVAAAPPDLAVTGTTVCSSPAKALLAEAAAADLLVVGSRGRGGIASLVLGSVSRRVAAQGPGVSVVLPRVAIAGRRRVTRNARGGTRAPRTPVRAR